MPRIVAVGKSVYVAWQSFNQQGIFFVRSIDGGASFENPIKLGKNPEGVKTPQLIAHGKSGVYVVWREHTQVTYSSPGVLMEVKALTILLI